MAVGIVGHACRVAALFESAVVLVAVEQAGGLVAGDIDIGPAVVIEIGDDHAEAIAAAGREDTGLFGHVGKRAVAIVVIERVVRHGESARAAHDDHALPLAVLAAPRLGSVGEIEVDIIGDKDIEIAVAIVIDKGAARTPSRAGDGQAGGLTDVREFSGAQIPVEDVVAVVGDEQIGMAVVIEVAHAGGLRPTGAGESGLLAHFGKVTPAVVAVELRRVGAALGSSVVPLAMKMSLEPSPL